MSLFSPRAAAVERHAAAFAMLCFLLIIYATLYCHCDAITPHVADYAADTLPICVILATMFFTMLFIYARYMRRCCVAAITYYVSAMLRSARCVMNKHDERARVTFIARKECTRAARCERYRRE